MNDVNHSQTPEDAAETADQATETVAANSEAEAADSATVQAQADMIVALEAKLKDAEDKALRAVAEAENTRRRAQKETQNAAKFGASKLAQSLLSVADNMERALEAAQGNGQDLLEQIKSGIGVTYTDLQKVLSDAGIVVIDPKGEIFDPQSHEVLFEIEDTSVTPGTVLQVVAKGYMIHDRLLRPAKVGVAKGGTAQEKNVDFQA